MLNQRFKIKRLIRPGGGDQQARKRGQEAWRTLALAICRGFNVRIAAAVSWRHEAASAYRHYSYGLAARCHPRPAG